jgi:hypothetical protein
MTPSTDDPSIDFSGPKLVRSALSTQRVNAAQITGAVAHFKDGPGALSPFLDEGVFDRMVPKSAAEESTLECFSIASHGVGFVAFTALKAAGLGEAPRRTVELAPSSLMRERLGRMRLRSRLRPGSVVHDLRASRPSRLGYTDTAVSEYLVKLPADAAVRPRAMRVAGTRIAAWVWDERHALTFIHWPSSPPAPAGAWRTAEGPCIRFGVATPRHDVAARLDFGRLLLERCAELGYGVWVRDGDEPGAAYDYWRCLFSPEPAAEGRTGTLWRPVPMPHLGITCVGPAHRGTTVAIMRILEEADATVPVFSVATLDDLSFVHVVADAPHGGPPVRTGDPAPTALRRLFGLRGPVDRSDPRLAGFRVMATPFPVPTHDPTADKQSLWLAWTTPATHNALSLVIDSARTALTGALESLAPGVPKPSIEYLLCRAVSVDRLRGRAKVSLDLDAVAPEGAVIGKTGWLGRLCSEIESRWRADLSFRLGTPRVDVEVVWRESWLGRWSVLQRHEGR